MLSAKRKFLAPILFFPIFFISFNFSDIPFIGRLFNSNKTPTSISKEGEIVYWGLFESESVMRPLIDEYEKAHPNVKIVYEPKDFSNLQNYKDTAFSRLENNTAPDILRIHSTWVPTFFPYLAEAPDTVYNKDSYSAEFFPAAVQTCVSSKGKVYAVPLMYEAMVVFYNQDILSENNISRLPRTWDDFRELAVSLTQKDERGNITRAGAAIGGAKNIAHASDILGLMLSQSNLKIPDDLDSERAAEVLDFYVSFTKEDMVWATWLPYSPIAFSEGKVAIILAPTWQSFSILESNPNLNIGIAAVPQIPVWGNPEITNTNWANFWVESVSKSSKNKETAWDFLKFLSQKQQREKLFKEGSRIRPFGNAFGLDKLSETLKNSDYINNVVLGAPYSKTGIITDRVGNDIQVEAINMAIDSALSGGSSKEALIIAKQTILDIKAKSPDQEK